MNAPSTVSVILFVCVAGVFGQVTTRTVIPRKFRYETACWDQLYGSPVSGWDYYTVTSKEKCQMKCVDAGPTCVAFFWRQTASWCRLNQMKHANRTLDCASWEHVMYAEETTEDTLHFAKPPTVCPVSNLPAVANAQHPNVNDPLTVGSVVTYLCDNGYSPAPGSNMLYTCNGVGQWNGNATCSQIMGCNGACTNAVMKPDGTSWRLCDGGGAGVCDPKKGRIEVNIGGTWGTVCDDLWESYASNLDVTCRMLGHSGSNGELRSMAYFGMGVGPILMDDVQCMGSEIILTQCYYNSAHNCANYEAQGVECI
ncbi:hypothetical protein DPMN_042781 [Dreissena polymorpha]|nr:hypothetical protein DPMN_042781 [Dreissena polymorpha]